MRPEGWEDRFAEQIAQANVRPFHRRDWNCAKFVHTCTEALLQAEIPYGEWKGSLEESVDAILERIDPRQAGRGDVVMVMAPEATLGVCLGRTAAFVTLDQGLHELEMSEAVAAWRV